MLAGLVALHLSVAVLAGLLTTGHLLRTWALSSRRRRQLRHLLLAGMVLTTLSSFFYFSTLCLG